MATQRIIIVLVMVVIGQVGFFFDFRQVFVFLVSFSCGILVFGYSNVFIFFITVVNGSSALVTIFGSSRGIRVLTSSVSCDSLFLAIVLITP